MADFKGGERQPVSLDRLSDGDRAAFLELDASGAFASSEARVTFLRDLTGEAVITALSRAGGTDWRTAARVARR